MMWCVWWQVARYLRVAVQNSHPVQKDTKSRSQSLKSEGWRNRRMAANSSCTGRISTSLPARFLLEALRMKFCRMRPMRACVRRVSRSQSMIIRLFRRHQASPEFCDWQFSPSFQRRYFWTNYDGLSTYVTGRGNHTAVVGEGRVAVDTVGYSNWLVQVVLCRLRLLQRASKYRYS